MDCGIFIKILYVYVVWFRVFIYLYMHVSQTRYHTHDIIIGKISLVIDMKYHFFLLSNKKLIFDTEKNIFSRQLRKSLQLISRLIDIQRRNT